MLRHNWLVAVASVAWALPLRAQATGMPSFSAPYRQFQQSEFGAVVSAPNGYGTAIEGMYGYGLSAFDIELRGGFYQPVCCRTEVLLGAEARDRIITHTEDFPLDGALVVGLGAAYENTGTTAYVPVGVSLGRRLPSSSSNVDLEPYVQPTALLVSSGGSAVDFVLGLGADLRLSGTFDARLSVGIGDLHGVALGAVWLH